MTNKGMTNGGRRSSVVGRTRLNTRFLARAAIVVLAVTALALALAAVFIRQIAAFVFPGYFLDVPDGPTPMPPAIAAPRGEPPLGPGGLKEYKRAQGGEYELTGSGFLLRLPGGTIVGVTTAHSVWTLGTPANQLDRLAFGLPDQPGVVVEFDTLYGPPGVPRTGDDFAVDFVLLRVDSPVDDSLVLDPDARGAPQPGERVALYGGLGEWNGGRRLFAGTVVEVSERGAWARMDETFEPGEMSGSPFISAHTGQVVGMTIAVARVGDLRLIGIHPIGHIVQVAEAATEFPSIYTYRR